MQILDPIDGTKGFVKGSDALYVVWFLYEFSSIIIRELVLVILTFEK